MPLGVMIFTKILDVTSAVVAMVSIKMMLDCRQTPADCTYPFNHNKLPSHQESLTNAQDMPEKWGAHHHLW